jgi:hypothetical protein
MSLENVDVGPARIHTFDVSHNGRQVMDLTEFIGECCAPEDTPVRTITGFVEGRILPVGEAIDLLILSAERNDPEVYHRFDQIRGELAIQLCYCSVLSDCWMMSRSGGEPPDAHASARGQVGRVGPRSTT